MGQNWEDHEKCYLENLQLGFSSLEDLKLVQSLPYMLEIQRDECDVQVGHDAHDDDWDQVSLQLQIKKISIREKEMEGKSRESWTTDY